MTKSSYMTRALKARDPRFARVLSRLGYERTVMGADEGAPAKKPVAPKAASQGTPDQTAGMGDEVAALRKQYQEIVGRKPFAGWNAETLKTKIAAAKA